MCLRNQGQTCFLNVVLQALYHTNEFRNCVMKISEADDKPVALALQQLFRELQIAGHSVGTEKLTKSFKWTAKYLAKQHDVQEFLRYMLNEIENLMKGE